MKYSNRTGLSRRRALFIGAACAGSALLPASIAASPLPVQNWRGNALGAHATIQLVGVSAKDAAHLFSEIEGELVRLEQIFSLYRTDSSLTNLNKTGRLDAPPAELLELLSIASAVHHQTGGLFDPSVQPLFALYAEHFSRANPQKNGPRTADLSATLDRVGFEHVQFSASRVQFARPDMALTLNGIAQGYISDKIADLLRKNGLTNVLVNMGEIVAVGAGPNHTGWRVGIDAGSAVSTDTNVLTLTDKAIATSAMLGTQLDTDGNVGHIFHPRLGPIVPSISQVTVINASAARADALSTAAALMDHEGIATLRQSGVEILV